MTMRVIAALALLTALVVADISVTIDRHFPCSKKLGPNKQNLRIKFPSFKDPGVTFTQEPGAGGSSKCYRMSGGEVEILGDGLSGEQKYSVHTEIRIGIGGKPEKCINAGPDGCGGIGSCVHCDICKRAGKLRNFLTIFKGEREAQCSADGFKAGTYSDLSLRLCLPTKSEMLSFLDKDEKRAAEIWKFLLNSRGKANEMPLVITARLFDRPINNLKPKDLSHLIHRTKEGEIGCHQIYAKVKDEG